MSESQLPSRVASNTLETGNNGLFLTFPAQSPTPLTSQSNNPSQPSSEPLPDYGAISRDFSSSGLRDLIAPNGDLNIPYDVQEIRRFLFSGYTQPHSHGSEPSSGKRVFTVSAAIFDSQWPWGTNYWTRHRRKYTAAGLAQEFRCIFSRKPSKSQGRGIRHRRTREQSGCPARVTIDRAGDDRVKMTFAGHHSHTAEELDSCRPPEAIVYYCKELLRSGISPKEVEEKLRGPALSPARRLAFELAGGKHISPTTIRNFRQSIESYRADSDQQRGGQSGSRADQVMVTRTGPALADTPQEFAAQLREICQKVGAKHLEIEAYVREKRGGDPVLLETLLSRFVERVSDSLAWAPSLVVEEFVARHSRLWNDCKN